MFNNEPHLTNHIKKCQKYNSDSPVAQIFHKIPLQSLEISHLVALKCEYLNYIQILSLELSKSMKVILNLFSPPTVIHNILKYSTTITLSFRGVPIQQ
jgi:hypothetical protein